MVIDSDDEEEVRKKKQQMNQLLKQVKKSEEELKDQVVASGFKIVKAKPENKEMTKPNEVKHNRSTRLAKKEMEEIKQQEEALDVKQEQVEQNDQERELNREQMTGKDALFALIAIRMMKLSQKYNKKLDELHYLFYTVSCDWE